MARKSHFDSVDFADLRRGLGTLIRRRDKLKFSCELYGLDAAMHVELLVDIAEVTFDRPGGNEDLIGDLLVRESLCDELHHFKLTFAQRIVDVPPGKDVAVDLRFRGAR